jgi:cold shock CspA family protein
LIPFKAKREYIIIVFLMKGKIKKYLSYRGFGFIEVKDDENDIFFHVSNYPVTSLPASGQEVEFSIIESEKGKEATGIRVIDKIGEVLNAEVNKKEPIQLIQSEQVGEARYLNELNGVGPKYQELLRASGFNFIQELAEETPGELFNKLNLANHENIITKKPPTLENVEAWINLARI